MNQDPNQKQEQNQNQQQQSQPDNTGIYQGGNSTVWYDTDGEQHCDYGGTQRPGTWQE